MSFANYDFEAQQPGTSASPELSGSSEIDAIINKTSLQIQNYGQLNSEFNNQRRLVGSKRDSPQLRQQLQKAASAIDTLGDAIKSLITDINRVMNSAGAGKDSFEVSNRQLMTKDRLVSEFNELYSNFQGSLKQHHDKEASHPLPTESTPLKSGSNINNAGYNSENAGSEQTQTQIQTQIQDDVEQTELQYHLLLTEERNRQIEQVAEGVREVNSIFRDLGDLVEQQGAQLDTVEENILQMSGNTQQASRELTKAHEYQKKKSRWSCFLLVALMVFVLIVVLTVVS